MRRARRLPAMIVAVLTVAVPAMAALAGGAVADESLYRARTVVTGSGADALAASLPRCLAAVLVKVSGDPSLDTDPAVAALAGAADGLVAAATFRDRMAGIPVHDEQGSRDRPHVLTVDFVPDRIDAALATLGRRPWPAPRPGLFLRVDVHNDGGGFALTRDGARGRDMREALAEAADRFGLRVTLPRADGKADARQDGADPEDFLPLSGRLAWDPGTLGWTAHWRLEAPDGPRAWSIRGVSFDAAFRDGVGGAARILSGNGDPG